MTDRRVTVHFHGSLSGPSIEVTAGTAAQVIELVSRQLPQFKRTINRQLRRVKVLGFDTVESLFIPLEVDELHLMPQMNGGGSGGWVQILIGAALVAASFITGMNPVLASILFKVGALLILGGLALMLSPTPQVDNSDQKSRYFGDTKNTVAIGTTIPVLCGRYKVSGQYLSFNVDARDVKAAS